MSQEVVMQISPQGASVTATEDEVPAAGYIVGWPVHLRIQGECGRYVGPVSIGYLDQSLNSLGLYPGAKIVVRHAN